MNIIQQLTKDCERDDCSIVEGVSMTTCMGWTPSYDKHGNRTDAGDPNSTSTEWRCSACGRNWRTSTLRGETVVCVEPNMHYKRVMATAEEVRANIKHEQDR